MELMNKCQEFQKIRLKEECNSCLHKSSLAKYNPSSSTSFPVSTRRNNRHLVGVLLYADKSWGLGVRARGTAGMHAEAQPGSPTPQRQGEREEAVDDRNPTRSQC